ncbi:MAG: 23S rRNA (uracil-5-)-methyltransferase RumA [Candidatus Woesearchaeota archaeon]|nr:MAG: 23S rRNA (uracil-5-)-methyltransferase RumA [Candidatus Woesearchaeota archaeon]
MVDALCPYFGKCGGCSSQHIPYEQQLEHKKNVVARNIGVDINTIKVFSDKPYNYRNRMDFIFHPGGLGLREKGNWKKIIDIEKCVISNDKINELLSEIRQFFIDIDYFDIRKKTGTYRYAVIRTSFDHSSISFVLNADSVNIGSAVEKIKEYSKISSAENIIVTYVPKNTDVSVSGDFFVVKGKDKILEVLLNNYFEYSVQGFFQNNTKMASIMHEYVHELIKDYGLEYTKKINLLDLYAGVGTFGIINSKFFKEVIIIESDKNCINSAEINMKRNNVNNAKTILLDVSNLKKLNLSGDFFVITDPPRSGMHPKTIEELNRIKPKNIIYISCNVEQLGKDLKKLNKYQLKSVAMFDLFPQTPHIEAIVELERIKE